MPHDPLKVLVATHLGMTSPRVWVDVQQVADIDQALDIITQTVAPRQQAPVWMEAQFTGWSPTHNFPPGSIYLVGGYPVRFSRKEQVATVFSKPVDFRRVFRETCRALLTSVPKYQVYTRPVILAYVTSEEKKPVYLFDSAVTLLPRDICAPEKQLTLPDHLAITAGTQWSAYLWRDEDTKKQLRFETTPGRGLAEFVFDAVDRLWAPEEEQDEKAQS